MDEETGFETGPAMLSLIDLYSESAHRHSSTGTIPRPVGARVGSTSPGAENFYRTCKASWHGELAPTLRL